MEQVSMTNSFVLTHISHATFASISVENKGVSQISVDSNNRVDVDIQDKSNNQSLNHQNIVDELNKISEEKPLSISFTYDKELNRSYINIIDKESGKVIRKLPSEEAIKFAKSIKESMIKLMDKRG